LLKSRHQWLACRFLVQVSNLCPDRVATAGASNDDGPHHVRGRFGIVMKRAASKPRNLREHCLRTALSIIEKDGVEQLSLREVARRLKVSHQAPYKHFPSRDHILAEIVSRAFNAFAVHLDARRKSRDPEEDLRGLGEAYLSYAAAHPLNYRLMFGTPLPDPASHPEMMQSAQHAFHLLHDCLTKLHGERGVKEPDMPATLDALFIWSNMHGLASIANSPALASLALPKATINKMVPHAMGKLRKAIDE
jgi:AcrR family transcriptional regulator